MGTDMNDQDQPGRGWTVVLRRRPVRIVEGRPEGGYTDEYEIICCHCGDDPDLDYREVSPELQRIRGPYPPAAGITRYVKHARRHPGPQETSLSDCSPGSRGGRLARQLGQGSMSGQTEHVAKSRAVLRMVGRR